MVQTLSLIGRARDLLRSGNAGPVLQAQLRALVTFYIEADVGVARGTGESRPVLIGRHGLHFTSTCRHLKQCTKTGQSMF